MLKKIILLLFVTLLSVSVNAFPALTGRVVDAAGILSDAAKQELTQLSLSAEPQQVVVATVSTLNGDTVEEYANTLFNMWELGDEIRNDGVLLLLAPYERRVRIEVGYGLEGTLTDAKAAAIIRKITPALQQNDFDAGLIKGMTEIARALDNPLLSLNLSFGLKRPEKSFGDIPVHTLDSFPFFWFLVILCGFAFALFNPFSSLDDIINEDKKLSKSQEAKKAPLLFLPWIPLLIGYFIVFQIFAGFFLFFSLASFFIWMEIKTVQEERTQTNPRGSRTVGAIYKPNNMLNANPVQTAEESELHRFQVKTLILFALIFPVFTFYSYIFMPMTFVLWGIFMWIGFKHNKSKVKKVGDKTIRVQRTEKQITLFSLVSKPIWFALQPAFGLIIYFLSCYTNAFDPRDMTDGVIALSIFFTFFSMIITLFYFALSYLVWENTLHRFWCAPSLIKNPAIVVPTTFNAFFQSAFFLLILAAFNPRFYSRNTTGTFWDAISYHPIWKAGLVFGVFAVLFWAVGFALTYFKIGNAPQHKQRQLVQQTRQMFRLIRAPFHRISTACRRRRKKCNNFVFLKENNELSLIADSKKITVSYKLARAIATIHCVMLNLLIVFLVGNGNFISFFALFAILIVSGAIINARLDGYKSTKSHSAGSNHDDHSFGDSSSGGGGFSGGGGSSGGGGASGRF